MTKRKTQPTAKKNPPISKLDLILFTESIASLLECGMTWDHAIDQSLIFLVPAHTEVFFKKTSPSKKDFSSAVIHWANVCRNYDLGAILRILMMATITGGSVAGVLRQYVVWIRSRGPHFSSKKMKYHPIADLFGASFEGKKLTQNKSLPTKDPLQKHSVILMIHFLSIATLAGLNLNQAWQCCQGLADPALKLDIDTSMDVRNVGSKSELLEPILKILKMVSKTGVSPIDILNSYRIYLQL